MGALISILLNFWDQSYNIPPPPLTEKNLPDQTGKVYLITGANSGVGLSLTALLYSHNATIHLACRSASKARSAISTIRTTHPTSKGNLHYLHLDLSDLTSIKSTVETFLSCKSKLHWLNNNAGVMFPPESVRSVQGHDMQFATNVLGPFLLTKLLLPVLSSTAESEGGRGGVRVSWAGSFAVDSVSPRGGVHFESKAGDGESEVAPKTFSGVGGLQMTYGSTKVANLWLAYEFGRRYGDRDGVLHNAYNPGNLATNLLTHVRATPLLGRLLHLIASILVLHPSIYGAYTELFAGLSPELTLPGDQGGYIVPWGRKAKWNREDVLAGVGEGRDSERLWDWCERETRAYT